MPDRLTLTLEDAVELCRRAAIGAGASEEVAASIAKAAVAAEAEGNTAVGLSHFVDYLEALRAGGIDGAAEPEITRPAPAVILSNAKRGTAHLGFDRAFDDLCAAAKLLGVAAFSQKNAYTSGALGYFVQRLAEYGFVALAATSGPALAAPPGVKKPVYCTNPIALAAPCAKGAPLVIDQSTSATAFVKIRKAAEAGDAIPEGWAIDAEGEPTTDAREAMRGALLTFGGERGANIALMVEVLASGLSGANWATDAPSFSGTEKSPGSGLFVLAMDPSLFGGDFAERLARQLNRLADEGTYIPGRRKATAREKAQREGISVPTELHKKISAFAEGPA